MHSKTTANRNRIAEKKGLDQADHRADTAFRASKCHRIKLLHRDPQWAAWSERKREAMKEAIIRELEEKHNKKKRENEIEFLVLS